MATDIRQTYLSKKIWFFYAIELITAITYTAVEGFSGLIWLTVAISFIGIIPKILSTKFKPNTIESIALICLLLSSALWGYITMYYLNSNPVPYTVILIARIIATIVAFKHIHDHLIVIIPLLIGFALLKQAGCIPPIAF